MISKFAILAVVAVFGAVREAAAAVRCGKGYSGVCPSYAPCCSKYGYCGATSAYCGSGCQSGCSGTPGTPAPTPKATPKPTVKQPTSGTGLTGTAAFTYYESYPECCWNPAADQTECTQFNGCKWAGQFAAIDGTMSLDWVKSHDIVSFFDKNNPNDAYFQSHYGGRTVRVTKGSVSFTALIADTCGNSDCNNCCTKNADKAGTRYLLDMEYWTVMRHFGNTDAADGTIQFQIL